MHVKILQDFGIESFVKKKKNNNTQTIQFVSLISNLFLPSEQWKRNTLKTTIQTKLKAAIPT